MRINVNDSETLQRSNRSQNSLWPLFFYPLRMYGLVMKHVLCLVLGLLFFPLIVGATTVKPFAFEGLCETAQSIVHVRCLEKQSLVIPDRDGIFTQYRFEVVTPVKGGTEKELVLVLPGGQVDGRHMEVLGMPKFVIGQETVLFLSEKDAYGSPWPVGLGQGCYGITMEDDGERQVIFERHHPIDVAHRSKPAIKNKVALKTFIGTIREVLKMETMGEDKTQ